MSFKLTDEEFNLISWLIHERFGIKLGEQKRTLIVGRLQKVLLSGEFNSFKEYFNHVLQDSTGRALLTLADRISTNYTFFFREKEHFDFLLATVLPQIFDMLKKKGSRDLRLWCAGCSSGEEPYSLAMVICEYFGHELSNLDIGILATDISDSALKEASAGVYPAERMSQLPLVYRQRYFSPLKDGSWVVKKSLKDLVLYRRLNLMRQEYPFKGRFQVIFCRNVMIYFDKATQQALVERFHRYLEPGGFLFIGHSESIDRSTGLFKYVKPSIYQKI